MFGHFPELVIICVLALIVFGPEKMPEMARNAGKVVREFREAMDQVMNPVDVDVPDDFSVFYQEEMERETEEHGPDYMKAYGSSSEFVPPAELGVQDLDLEQRGGDNEVFPHIAAEREGAEPEAESSQERG